MSEIVVVPKDVSPGQGLNLLVAELLQRLFPDQRDVPSAVQARLRALSDELKQPVHRGRDVRRASKHNYDRWIENIFRAVVDGTRRETLIAEFMEELRGHILAGRSETLFAVVIEESLEDETHHRALPRHYTVVAHCGLPHPDHWRRFGEELARGSRNEDAEFWRGLFAEPEGLELIFSRYWPDYKGELDALVNASLKQIKSPVDRGFWFSSIGLRSDDPTLPKRVLVLAHENLGAHQVPRPAEGASMEWRVLFFFYIAYLTADYGARNLHKEVAEQRDRLVQSLAPGILAHELASELRALHNNTVLMASALQSAMSETTGASPSSLAGRIQRHHTELGRHLLRLADHCGLLLRSSSAFLNLARAHGVERFQLSDVVSEALTLARSRLARAAVVETDGLRGIELLCDRPLLVVVLLNVLSNAAKAIAPLTVEDEEGPRNRVRIVAHVHASRETPSTQANNSAWLRLAVANDGPPIPPDWQGLVFLRGRTTDPEGHGQGLYLCRKICRYLGGDIQLSPDPTSWGASMHVAFVVDIPLEQPDALSSKSKAVVPISS